MLCCSVFSVLNWSLDFIKRCKDYTIMNNLEQRTSLRQGISLTKLAIPLQVIPIKLSMSPRHSILLFRSWVVDLQSLDLYHLEYQISLVLHMEVAALPLLTYSALSIPFFISSSSRTCDWLAKALRSRGRK